MIRLLVATNNPGKLIELRALLVGLPAELVSPADLGLVLDVDEDGSTYVENAVKKAAAFAAASGLVSLADDTGLEVESLGGAPGMHSKRYLPTSEATDADRRAHLVRNLRGRPRPWLARFRAAVAVSKPGGETRWCEGVCEGEIVPEELGDGGFGYDRLFLVAGTGLTMAQLNLPTKNQVSHRGRAALKLLPELIKLLS